MKRYLRCRKIETAIRRAKKALIAKGVVYENFGRRKVREIEDVFIDISIHTPEMDRRRNLLAAFDEWCMTYTGGER